MEFLDKMCKILALAYLVGGVYVAYIRVPRELDEMRIKLNDIIAKINHLEK